MLLVLVRAQLAKRTWFNSLGVGWRGRAKIFAVPVMGRRWAGGIKWWHPFPQWVNRGSLSDKWWNVFNTISQIQLLHSLFLPLFTWITETSLHKQLLLTKQAVFHSQVLLFPWFQSPEWGQPWADRTIHKLKLKKTLKQYIKKWGAEM